MPSPGKRLRLSASEAGVVEGAAAVCALETGTCVVADAEVVAYWQEKLCRAASAGNDIEGRTLLASC